MVKICAKSVLTMVYVDLWQFHAAKNKAKQSQISEPGVAMGKLLFP